MLSESEEEELQYLERKQNLTGQEERALAALLDRYYAHHLKGSADARRPSS